jgi:hypothetical protein
MAQKGKLSKAEIFFIQQHGHITPEEIAHELDRPVSTVMKHYVPTPKEEKKKESTPFMKLMGRHERNGKKVATVLTTGAAQLADSIRPQLKVDTASYIHKPMGD